MEHFSHIFKQWLYMSSNSSTALLRNGEILGEETKASKCISICKVPDLSCRWGKRLESLTILFLQIVFYSRVSEFLLRKTCLSYSFSFLFVIDFFFMNSVYYLINDSCPHGLPSSFCRIFVNRKTVDTFINTSCCDLNI